MAKRLARASLNLLLALSLLAGGVIPPAVRHAHEGGNDLAHQHDVALAGSLEDARHTECDDHHTLPAGASPVTALIACDSHFHVQWLGFQVTLSGRDTSGPVKSSEDHRTSEWVFVRAVRDMNPAPQNGLQVGRSSIVDLHQPLPGDTAEVSASVSPSSCPVTVSPLCDRARHERSGVLLA